MQGPFTVKYGKDGDKFRYTHDHFPSLDEATARCDRWLAGNGWGGYAPGEMRCWVEDRMGKVVYGTAALRRDQVTV